MSTIKIKKSKQGSLHAHLGINKNKNIPRSKLSIKSTDSPSIRKKKQFAINAKKWHHEDGGYLTVEEFVNSMRDYGFGSWLGDNIGNIAQTLGGAALIATGAGAGVGAGMMASGVGGFAKTAASEKINKNQEELNQLNNIQLVGQDRLNQYNANNKNQGMIPTFAMGGSVGYLPSAGTYAKGGHLPEGNSTLKEAKEFIKLYPDEMNAGTEVEYEHTGNKKLAQRIAADHVKDSLKMNQGGAPDYYKKLQAAGISDELNKMPQVMANGGPLKRTIYKPIAHKQYDDNLKISRTWMNDIGKSKSVEEMYNTNIGEWEGKPMNLKRFMEFPPEVTNYYNPNYAIEFQKNKLGLPNTFNEINSKPSPQPGYTPSINSKVNGNNVAYYNMGGYFGPAGSISGGIGDVPSFGDVNPMTKYKGGGTHEQNPNGGIQVGKKARVEEGEVRVDFEDGSYIFSNRY
jgi:hypothetical protein